MRKKSTVAASLALSLCVLAGCSTENVSSDEKDINIIDIGGASSQSSSTRSSISIAPAAPPVSSFSSGSTIISSSSSSTTVSSTAEESGAVPELPAESASESGAEDPSEPPAPPVSDSSLETRSSVESSGSEPSSSGQSYSTLIETDTPLPNDPPTSSEPVPSSSNESSSNEPGPVPSCPTSGYCALNYGEVKGIWISYLDIMEMSSGTESAFRSEIAAVYDNCAALGINTVYVHVRSHGDAYYNSDLFPRTKYLSGSYDPLPIMTEEAHKRNLSFQAWINPLRMCAEKDLSLGRGYAVYDWAGGSRLVKVNSYYYLNPAYSEVIDLITRGAAEIVANYDVDGLHIDDYFYPTTDASFDSEAFANSGYAYVSDFRRANCDRLVSALYSAVKTANPTAVFGVSCQGNMDNNYNEMYADVQKWCRSSGYLDYIMPQIYFGFNNSTQPFEECVRSWDNVASKGNVPLIVGMTAAKIGAEDVWAGAGRNEWLTDSAILRRQFLKSAEQASYGGVCLFRYRLLFAPSSGVKAQIESEKADLGSVLNQG